MKKMRVVTVAYLPDDLAKDWLQHLRDFDSKHPDCHFEVLADIPEKKIEDVLELLRIQPAFDFMEVIKKN